ncbi:phosphoglycerol transferase [Proteiniclasticum ruminis]|uniref:Phosphoglycerol transferase n=2 Tax=Proteiniclasticum ruminis TaxID=398199 RepID=A0A1I5A4A7_9CLOT|nr:phosphoglycerol transferase [Proteiniclasticum ruminis]
MLVAGYVALILAVGLYRLVEWARLSFSDLTLDQIIFHVKVPLDGADTTMVGSALKYVLTPIGYLLIIILIVHTVHSRILIRSTYRYNLIFSFKLTEKYKKEVTIRILPFRLIKTVALFSALVILLSSFITADKNFNVLSYVKNQYEDSLFIEENYVEPSTNTTFPKEKRNLIYIYLESLENTFSSKSNGGALETDLIEELSALAQENISFSNSDKLGGFEQAVGAGWTMGDLLEKEGYSNNLLIGSDAVFGGRKNFFEQHGNYTIYDYNYAKDKKLIPEDYFVFWGYEDHKLFDIAKIKLSELHQQEEPFNLTMLTVDTHAEDGYLCDLCSHTYDDQYANVISCSSKQIAEFIEWVQKQVFYENTSIVIVGDHLTMDSDFLDDIDPDYQRTIYNAFINSGFEDKDITKKNRQFNTYDIFPTVLATLNVEIKNNRLGLGTNLFSQEETLLEKYGHDMNLELAKNSKYYQENFIYGNGIVESSVE